jgi:hypothetical protein
MVMIPNYTIFSDKVLLTANYYIEYLGFNLLYKDEEDNPYVWLEFNQQFVLIWPWNNKLGIAKPVKIEVLDIHEHFEKLSERTRINVPLHKDDLGVSNFSILDCEDNIIHFVEQSSSVMLVTNDQDSVEFA